jgi:diguanylate cyclase (GGDEF)-like protein
MPGTELNIYAPAGFQRSLEDSLSGQMQYSYFPVRLNDLSSRIHYRDLEEGFFRIGDVLVETQYLNHTSPTIAYRLSSEGTTIAYVTDHEPFWNSEGPVSCHPGDQRHISFMKGADLVIHDAQYTLEEYRTKHGWGHSPIDYVVDVAIAAGVSRLALFHHDPTHDDTLIKGLERGARERAAASGSDLDVFAASEGVSFDVIGRGSATAIARSSALQRRPISGGRVLLVSDQMSEIAAIEQVLSEDGLVITACPDGRSALSRAPAFLPDLVILNSRLADGPGSSYVDPLRSLLSNPHLPIVLLSEGSDPGALNISEGVATDYLAKPFGPPMLRTRVRAWLARTMNGSTHHEHAAAVSKPMPASLTDPAIQITDNRSFLEGLASVSLLHSLSHELLERLLARSSNQIFRAGQTIIRQGESSRAVYVVLSGRVRIVEAVADSPVEMFLGELGPGEIFGELAILKERPRSATVMGLEKTSCLVMPEDDFLEVLHKSPNMSIELMRVIAGRLYDADRVLARYAPDPLTGLPGRRAFHDLYRRLTAGAKRRGSNILLLAVDVIHLKEINDKFGYSAGDDVLRTVANALIESSRMTDLVARYGGDEFAALLLDAAEKDVDVVVNRIHQKLQDMVIERGLPYAVHCRIGFSFSVTPPDTVDELLRIADQDMQGKQPAQNSATP